MLNCLALLSKCQLISQSKPVAHLLNSGNIQAIHRLDIFHQCSYDDSALQVKERNVRNTSSILTKISICFPSGGRKIRNWCISHLFRKLFLRMQPFANEMLLDKGAEISETPFWQKGFWIVLGKISWKPLHTGKVSAFQQDTADSLHFVSSGKKIIP